MTKLTKKKLNKSTLAIIFLAVALIACISFGATFALFTATSKTLSSSAITTGHIKLTTSGTFQSVAQNVLPSGSLLNAAVSVTPDTADAANGGQYVAMKLVISGTKGVATAQNAGTGAALNGAELSGALEVTVASGWYQQTSIGGTSSDADYGFVYIFGTSSAPTAMTAAETPLTAANGIVFKSTAADTYNEQTDSFEVGLMHAQLTISIQFKSIQATGNTSMTPAALAALFTP